MKRLRDGLYGQGPFARWADEFPATLELERAIGLVGLLGIGGSDPPGWQESEDGLAAGCGQGREPLRHPLRRAREKMRDLLVEGFGPRRGPAPEALLLRLRGIDYMLIGTFKTPFLLEGGPQSHRPELGLPPELQDRRGRGAQDTVQFWVSCRRRPRSSSSPST
jgi:hypothetical protein